jgi:hypothetical protein
MNFGYQGFACDLAPSGRIDGDGVRASGDDAGIGSVTVTLVDCGANGNCGDGDDSTVGTQSTSSNGFYMFENLTIGGRYQATVSTGTLPAGTWTNTDEDAPSGSSGVAVQGTTATVLVTAVLHLVIFWASTSDTINRHICTAIRSV